MQPVLDTRLRWASGHAPADPALHRRIEAEVRAISWTLSQLQALLDEAVQLASPHAYLLPRMEVRLPLYEDGLRYRVRLEQLDGPTISLVDETGARVAQIVLI